MKTYTEDQLLKAIQYACAMQKAEDYQRAGHYLIGAEDQDKAIEETLNYLSDSDDNQGSVIGLKEIDDYLFKGW